MNSLTVEKIKQLQSGSEDESDEQGDDGEAKPAALRPLQRADILVNVSLAVPFILSTSSLEITLTRISIHMICV